MPGTHLSSQIADEWAVNAGRLADWAAQTLVNRTDVWGQYLPLAARTANTRHGRVYPRRSPRREGALTRATLVRHFQGHAVGDVIGLHASSAAGQARWLGFDIDAHRPDDDPAVTWGTALAVIDSLERYNLVPVVEDSDGHGGFHIWVLFDQPAEAGRLIALGRSIRAAVGRKMEVFPASVPAAPELGLWFRLPGRHHTRPHWSRIWDGTTWLEGAQAVNALISAPLNDAEHLPEAAPPRTRAHRRIRRSPALPNATALGSEASLARACLRQLSPARADQYGTWLQVGMALHSISPGLLGDWDRWSQQSPSYEPGACTGKWSTFSGSRLGLNSLRYWVRSDSSRKGEYHSDASPVVNDHRHSYNSEGST